MSGSILNVFLTLPVWPGHTYLNDILYILYISLPFAWLCLSLDQSDVSNQTVTHLMSHDKRRLACVLFLFPAGPPQRWVVLVYSQRAPSKLTQRTILPLKPQCAWEPPSSFQCRLCCRRSGLRAKILYQLQLLVMPMLLILTLKRRVWIVDGIRAECQSGPQFL